MTTSELVSPALLQQWAREAYRKSLAAGQPLNRAQLAEQFDRSESWARDRIKEVREQDGLTDDSGPDSASDTPTDTLPPVVADPSPVVPVAAVPPAVEQLPVTDVDSPDMTPASADMTPADTPVAHHRGARFVAWFGFAFGSAVSIGGNWLAAWLPQGDMPPDWAPVVAAQVFAGVWPVALLIVIEVLSRTGWPSSWGKWARVVITVGGGGVVGFGSAAISYGHLHALLLSWGYDKLGAGVGPLVIDGLMVVSGFALLAMSTGRQR